MIPDSAAETAVFFTTDYGFLIPTLVVALQIRRQAAVNSGVDILVFLIDYLESETSELNAEYKKAGIHFVGMHSSAYHGRQLDFHKSHIPKSALARLCVGEHMPAQYKNLVYIDGDVQVVGDISLLLKWEVRPGFILAGLDQGLLEDGEPGSAVSKWYASYTSGLGVPKSIDYFNSGVMGMQRSTLLDMGPAALRYFQENSSKCILIDQSALNSVFVGRREYLSPRYNFMPRFQAIGGAKIVKPAIIHFADRNKPWHDAVPPWMAEYSNVYKRIVQEHDILKKYVQHMSKLPKGSPYRPDLLKSAALLLVSPARRIARRRKLRNYMAETAFAFK